MLTKDNRNMSDMESYYIARIEALQKQIADLKADNRGLRDDVAYLDRQLTKALGQQVA